jgi:hypothetical protein
MALTLNCLLQIALFFGSCRLCVWCCAARVPAFPNRYSRSAIKMALFYARFATAALAIFSMAGFARAYFELFWS